MFLTIMILSQWVGDFLYYKTAYNSFSDFTREHNSKVELYL
jgi:hypothetical protein